MSRASRRTPWPRPMRTASASSAARCVAGRSGSPRRRDCARLRPRARDAVQLAGAGADRQALPRPLCGDWRAVARSGVARRGAVCRGRQQSVADRGAARHGGTPRRSGTRNARRRCKDVHRAGKARLRRRVSRPAVSARTRGRGCCRLARRVPLQAHSSTPKRPRRSCRRRDSCPGAATRQDRCIIIFSSSRTEASRSRFRTR